MKTAANTLRWLCVLCFLGAAIRHGFDLLRGGWLPYSHVSLWINAFWTALTVLDPLAALLLLRWPQFGALLSLVIMLADVGINTTVTLRDGSFSSVTLLTLLAQTVFLGVVMGGFPLLWSLQPKKGQSKNA